MDQYDVAIIGGGPGGYVAAIRLAQLNKKVVLIEKEHLGGICLNWGCIPTKALLKSAEIYTKLKNSNEYGIKAEKISFDLEKIVERSRNISDKLTSGIKSLMKKNKITVIEGFGAFENSKVILINNKDRIKANNIIIATGASPKIIPGFEPSHNIWTSKEAMIPKEMPNTLVIIGSGAIGIEYASFYNAFGVNVTVLESQGRILPVEDEEISAFAKKMFEKKGIKFHLNVKLTKQTANNSGHLVDFQVNENSYQIQADKILMAVGIKANSAGFGIEKTQIKLEREHIVTNEFMQTNEPCIYAIGDVTGAPWLAHKASHEGIIAAEHIAGLKVHGLNKLTIPGCTYSSPQVASVGYTEEAAKKAGYEIKVGRFPFSGNGKALVLGEAEGLIKTIFDNKTGELLGAHMIGVEVTELIQGYVVAKNMEGTELDLMNTIFAHPTLSEMMHESVLQAFGKAVHI